MRLRPKKKAGKSKEMSIDQQIEQCEERIATLENWKREKTLGKPDPQQLSDYNGNLEMDLDKAYERIALLKIRRMMGY
jgi:hypothetical protein